MNSKLQNLSNLSLLTFAAVLACGALQAACSEADDVDQGRTESNITAEDGNGYGYGYGYGASSSGGGGGGASSSGGGGGSSSGSYGDDGIDVERDEP